MSNPKTIVVLGADRVGKSTIIENTRRFLHHALPEARVKKLHFSGPQPHHNSPIEQYTDPFNEARREGMDYILCDRGFSEVCFYDRFRRNLNTSEEWANAAESYFAAYSEELHVFMIERDWEWSLPHHIEELKQILPPGTTEYYMSRELQIRKKEHNEYYFYMSNYLKNRSLLKNVRYISPSEPDYSLLIKVD